MPLRVGLISTAHVHAPSFAKCLQEDMRVELVGLWDDDAERGRSFAGARQIRWIEALDELLAGCDAVVISSENMRHAEHISRAAGAGKHVLCEKPIAARWEDIATLESLILDSSDLVLATAFPCPFSPNFTHALGRIENGDIGKLLAINATNQGKCPGGWFVDSELSGGGAMIDHVVHVADLLRRTVAGSVARVQAQVGNKLFHRPTDDVAMVTVEFETGVFATIDSSWSKPTGNSTWGNVKVSFIGEKGVIETDLFAQGVMLVGEQGYQLQGSGSDLDSALVGDFVDAVLHCRLPKSTLADGLWASKIALLAYDSVRAMGEPAAAI